MKLRLSIQLPQLIVLAFLIVMMGLAFHLHISLTFLISDALIRLVMNGILVLSLVPMLNAGIGINYGLPVAITAGLLGLCLAVNFRITGLLGFSAALLFAVPLAAIFGYGYARILNWVKGREEITAIFIGFSFVPLMNFFWAVAPFSNPAMLWPIGGKGLRPTIGLRDYFSKELNTIWDFHLFGLTVPVGLLLFFALCCLAVWIFFKTRTGIAMIALGENEAYAKLAGLNISHLRILAVILSTVLGAIGICVYAQSYGFIELYDAPQMMAFPAASAILLGGSAGKRTTLLHVVLGTFLFQTTYLISGPIANEILVPEVAEIFRMMITNGIILYALMHEGKMKRGGYAAY
ncbi:MAG: ABC transporter permease [Proteobacteria bacterium]|nr:ABC transporter permease [Pseudomonadota bacterium]